jgi:ABC-type multidrug transport system permease subunit
MSDYHPLQELLWFRLRLFYREPAAVFWTYVFPMILTVSLGIAFRNKPPEAVVVDIQSGPRAAATAEAFRNADPQRSLIASIHDAKDAEERLRLAKCSVVVVPGEDGNYAYRYDPSRPESVHARLRVDDVLQRAAGRQDAVAVSDSLVTEPGSRYIDFLVPGLLGMNLMGTGLWGVGFVTADLRIRRLLKRFVATPMRRSDFLLSLIGGRMVFTLPEMAIVLLFGALLFAVPIRGNILSILVVVLMGGISFSGIGLLVACRADRIETVSGLMNLVMLPMWLLSGIFFSTDHFPDAIQPAIQALPLTQLNNALRAVVLEGAPLASQWVPILVLAAFGAVSFFLALRWFRWT